MEPFHAGKAAAFLASHLREHSIGEPGIAGPATRAEAYQVQDRLIGTLGGACAWKVGRAATSPEPYCAPISSARRVDNAGPYARFEGVARLEAELGFRLGRDVPPSSAVLSRSECVGLVDAIVPAIEILETRLAPAIAQDPLWKLADLQGNGGLVLGAPAPWAGQDLGTVDLAVGADDGAGFVRKLHPFGEPVDLFCWTLNHVASRRGGLRRGDVVITGSYCGIVEIRDPGPFVARFAGYPAVGVSVA